MCPRVIYLSDPVDILETQGDGDMTMTTTKEPIEFYDVKYKQKIKVARDKCSLKTFQTKRGQRTRIVAVMQSREDPSKEYKLSKLCSKDFVL